jgi:hypothetical protein
VNPVPRIVAAAAVAAGLLLAGCAGGRRVPNTIPAAETVGTYRSEYTDGSGEVRRFRLQLFAAAPDRLHVEVVTPVGTTEAIVDGGAGRVALSIPRRRSSWVGDADETAMGSLIGLPLTLSEIVGAILGDEVVRPGCEVHRSPDDPGFLPSELEIAFRGVGLRLRLKRARPIRGDPAVLGTGDPPPGMEVHPLKDWIDSNGPLLVEAGEEGR